MNGVLQVKDQASQKDASASVPLQDTGLEPSHCDQPQPTETEDAGEVAATSTPCSRRGGRYVTLDSGTVNPDRHTFHIGINEVSTW